jgi:hypothetical protein
LFVGLIADALATGLLVRVKRREEPAFGALARLVAVVAVVVGEGAFLAGVRR